MALLPHLLNDFLDDQYIYPFYQITPGLNRVAQALQNLEHQVEGGLGNVTNQDGLFKVNIDIQQFKPEEVNVKIVDDSLVVEAKHEERQDRHGYISRQFTRRYKLPEGTNYDAVKSNVSSDGVLTIVAPTKIKSVEGTVRQIPITYTNQPAIKKDQTEQQAEKAKN